MHQQGSYRLLWGDLHNHNAIGYAVGSLERSIEIARSHLDFFAFTGHSQWHDMNELPDGKHLKWVRGFEVLRANWPKVQRLMREANEPGKFTAILGYEWHSSRFGDHCLLYPGDAGELFYADHVRRLQEHARKSEALLIPHHLAYAKGMRGVDWGVFDPSVSPVVEIYSEHGGSEADRGPWPMLRHSMGGRSTTGTIQYALSQGLRFGFVASTDDHLGCPGAYGEGLAAVWTTDNNRNALFAALRARRTYAVSGDRIALWFELNGRPMGSELPHCEAREIRLWTEGWDALEVVEILRNGRIVQRFYPDQEHAGSAAPPRPLRIRIQYGWGPWSGLGDAAIADWRWSLTLSAGRILDILPCWQSGPFDEHRRDKILERSDRKVRVVSFTGRNQAFAEDPTKSLLLEIDAPRDATLSIQVEKPAPVRLDVPLPELLESSCVAFAGPFGSESMLVHRLIEPQEFRLEAEWLDQRPERPEADWYYVRVKQANGHMAWSSPIWVG